MAAAIGGLVGGMAQSQATEYAADKQSQAARDARNQQWNTYQQQRADQAPWLNTGRGALGQLGWLMGIAPQGGGVGGSGNGQWVDKNGTVGDISSMLPNMPMSTFNQVMAGQNYNDPMGKDLILQKFIQLGGVTPKDYDPKNIAKYDDYIRDAYSQFMAKKGYTQQAGSGGQGAFQGDPSTFGSLAQKFDASKFQTDPGYQFRMQEGAKALERSGAARGMSLSGAQLKGLDRYNQDFASNEYSNAYNRFNNDQANTYNRYANLAGLGQTAVNQIGQAGQNAANNMGNYMTQGANAQAAGAIAQGNIWGNFAQNMGNYWQQAQQQNGGQGSNWWSGSSSNGPGSTDWSNGYMGNDGQWVGK